MWATDPWASAPWAATLESGVITAFGDLSFTNDFPKELPRAPFRRDLEVALGLVDEAATIAAWVKPTFDTAHLRQLLSQPSDEPILRELSTLRQAVYEAEAHHAEATRQARRRRQQQFLLMEL